MTWTKNTFWDRTWSRITEGTRFAFFLRNLGSATGFEPATLSGVVLTKSNNELLISRRVDFTCNGNYSWYGETLARFNLVDSLIALGQAQESDAVELAMELNQGADRIESLAALAQQATQKIVANESSSKRVSILLASNLERATGFEPADAADLKSSFRGLT